MPVGSTGPVEAKVSAAAVAAAISSLLVWVLQSYVFAGEVPFPVAAAVQVAVPALVTLAAAWLAPHTHRSDLDAGGGRHALRD